MSQANHSSFRLDGQTTLITGGGSGIGLAIAECFLAAGAHVVLCGRREAILEQACRRLGGNAIYRVYDVNRLETAQNFIEELESSGLTIDTLVNTAGNHLKKTALETSCEEFSAILQTHVEGAFSLTKECCKRMIGRRSGCVLFVASMASFLAIPKVVAYAAAKSAVMGMVRGLTAELAPHGIRVNAIAPGWIETEMLRNALAGDIDRERKILGRTPMQRFGDPLDVGNAAVFLSSSAAKFVTGVVLPVDGGASIGF